MCLALSGRSADSLPVFRISGGRRATVQRAYGARTSKGTVNLSSCSCESDFIFVDDGKIESPQHTFSGAGSGPSAVVCSVLLRHPMPRLHRTARRQVQLQPVTIDDISGDGITDLARLGRRDDNGAVRRQTKRSDTGVIPSNAIARNTDVPIAIFCLSANSPRAAPGWPGRLRASGPPGR
jgi:hypothetical protein